MTSTVQLALGAHVGDLIARAEAAAASNPAVASALAALEVLAKQAARWGVGQLPAGVRMPLQLAVSLLDSLLSAPAAES